MSQSEAMRCPERSRIVRERYADALPEEITEWARLWNVSREAIRRRASELGIKRKAWVAQQAHLETARAMADVATECGSDEDYTALCLQQGGFPRAEIINGQTAWVRIGDVAWSVLDRMVVR